MKVTPHIDSRVTDPGWTLAPPDWTERALCAQVGDDDVWFPPKGGTTDPAKRVCRRCPVRRFCLEDAMVTEGRHAPNTTREGIWGGLSAIERRRLAVSGWQPGDPLPPVRLAHPTGTCPHCSGKYGDALRLHVESAHPSVGAA